MANYTPRVGQTPKTNVTPLASAYVSSVDISTGKVQLVNQSGYLISAYYYSPYPVSAGQTVHYVTDTQGNYVVVGSPSTEQKSALFARVYSSTPTNLVSPNQRYALTLNVVQSDAYSMWSVANSRFTAPVTGIYSLSAGARFASSSDTFRMLEINKNADAFSIAAQRISPGTEACVFNVTTTVKLNANDWVKVFVTHGATNALTTVIQDEQNFFSICYIGPA